MNSVDVADDEMQVFSAALSDLEDDATPIVVDISKHTRLARKAMDQDPVDTLTISNEMVELSILNQRLGDRIATMGHIARGAKEWYERVREGWKVRLVQGYTDEDGKRFEGVAAGVADSMKIEHAHDVFEVYNLAEKLMDQLVYARKSTDKTIDTMRSKLSYEKVNERNA